MTVELVHCTPNAEWLIVKMARVSNPENADNKETAPRLLRYLLKHKHFSPFEMASMCIKIETERDIAAQIIRHRSFSFQEYSTRYAQTGKGAIPALRTQDLKNRQASHDDLSPELSAAFESRIGYLLDDIYTLYEDLLESGIAKECARRILPLCTPTTIFMQGTLRSWLHYIDLRAGVETQLEHRQIAEQCKAIFCEQFPVIGEAYWPNQAGEKQ
jgi:thymidylate synthase (FAD)